LLLSGVKKFSADRTPQAAREAREKPLADLVSVEAVGKDAARRSSTSRLSELHGHAPPRPDHGACRAGDPPFRDRNGAGRNHTEDFAPVEYYGAKTPTSAQLLKLASDVPA
jgi:hypothetical protein